MLAAVVLSVTIALAEIVVRRRCLCLVVIIMAVVIAVVVLGGGFKFYFDILCPETLCYSITF